MIETDYLEHLGFEYTNFGIIEVDFKEYIKDNITVRYYPKLNEFRLISFDKESGEISKKYRETDFYDFLGIYLLEPLAPYKLFKRSRTIKKILK